MKTLKLNKTDLELIWSAIQRPNDSASVKTFLSIQRLEQPLMLLTHKNMSSEEVEVLMEDYDYEFLLAEWDAANQGRGIWTRSSPDFYNFMKSIISLDEKLRKAKDVKSK